MFQKLAENLDGLHVVSDVYGVTKNRYGGTVQSNDFVTKAITSSDPKHDILASCALRRTNNFAIC